MQRLQTLLSRFYVVDFLLLGRTYFCIWSDVHKMAVGSRSMVDTCR